MPDIVLSCSGIYKTFRRRVIPTVHLQDYLLHWKSHSKLWSYTALNNVSLSVKPGEWVGLYGPNGTGKTTLLRILAGLMKPDSGDIQCNGRLSCFFDILTGFHPERTASENIYLNGLCHGLNSRDIRSTIQDVIEFAGVASHQDLPMKCYSAGMQVRTAFAAAAMIDADMYLFDEVLAVGDAAFQEQCKLYLHSMRAQGKSALLVSHSFPQLQEHCDRILILEDGVLREKLEEQ